MWFDLLELIGIVSFSISGAMIAIKKKTDLFGVLFLGVITAFGGGFLRDLTLGEIPPSMFSHRRECLLSMLTSLLVFCLAYCFFDSYQKEEQKIDSINNFFDAIGLGAFSVTGTQVALSVGYDTNAFLCICMGMITGMGGGVIRDLLVREIPFVLKKHVYALASIAGSATFYCLNKNLDNAFFVTVSGVVVTFSLRMLATRYHWNLPKAGVHR